MIRCYVIFFIVLFVSFGSVLSIDHWSALELVKIYDSKLRPYLFTGFLTIGGFLLSLKVFILISLKDKLYDQSYYKQLYQQRKQFDPKLTFYGSLVNLGSLLVFCVGIAILTAIFQITLGVIPNILCIALCIGLAHATLVMVMYTWWQIRGCLFIWFEHLREQNDG